MAASRSLRIQRPAKTNSLMTWLMSSTKYEKTTSPIAGKLADINKRWATKFSDSKFNAGQNGKLRAVGELRQSSRTKGQSRNMDPTLPPSKA